MGLLDILNAWKTVKTDIENGAYLQAWEDTIPAQQGMIDFGKSLGFKAAPGDAATADEIEATMQECVDCCKKDKTKMAVGAFDWKTLVMQIIAALLEAWKNKP